jgi:hypothetical protein
MGENWRYPKWKWSSLQALSMIIGKLVEGQKRGGGVGYFLLPEKNMTVHKAPELKLYVNVKVKG